MYTIVKFYDLANNGLAVHREKTEWSSDMFVLFACFCMVGWMCGTGVMGCPSMCSWDESDVDVVLCWVRLRPCRSTVIELWLALAQMTVPGDITSA